MTMSRLNHKILKKEFEVVRKVRREKSWEHLRIKTNECKRRARKSGIEK